MTNISLSQRSARLTWSMKTISVKTMSEYILFREIIGLKMAENVLKSNLRKKQKMQKKLLSLVKVFVWMPMIKFSRCRAMRAFWVKQMKILSPLTTTRRVSVNTTSNCAKNWRKVTLITQLRRPAKNQIEQQTGTCGNKSST
jgi:hypothetical protein